MMRETRGIWRGKCIDNGDNEKWVEGVYNCVDNSITTFESLSTSAIVETGIFYVDPSTLGMCTDLPDKNKNLIFEGDIIQYETQGVLERYIVVWNDESALFAVKGLSGLLVGDFTFFDPQRCEIIGNIHDNLTEYGSELVDKLEV